MRRNTVMKKIFSILSLLVITSFSSSILAAGAFFTVSVSGSTITITPTVSFTYPQAGIKINTSGYSINNIGTDCTLLSNGYCSFSASPSSSKSLTISGTGTFSATLCLNANGLLQCQNYSITTTTTQCTTSNPTCLVMVSKNLVDGAMNVTSTSGAPDVSSCTQSGVDKADCICGIEGPAANGGVGTWKAWLGHTTIGNPRERLDALVGGSAFPSNSSWVSQETGSTIYSTWGALSNDINTYADASNPISASTTPVHTGGYNNSGSSPSSRWAWTCNNWTSTSGSVDPGNPNGLNASSNAADSWNDSGGALCATASPIYCTEIQP